MNLKGRVDRLNEKANWLLRESKSDILVLILPDSDEVKGWYVDVCNNYKTGHEATALRQHLEGMQTLEEVAEALQGYATNLPGVMRSNEYM